MKKKITFSKSGVGNLRKSEEDIRLKAIDFFLQTTGAVRSDTSNNYVLNGLTDIKKEEMCAIYDKKESIYNLDLWEVLRGCSARTIPPCGKRVGSVLKNRPLKGYYSFADSLLEVLKFGREQTLDECGAEELLPVESLDGTFSNCRKLHTIYPMNIANVHNIGYKTFENCTALNELRLHGLCSPLNLASSPLLSHASLLYIINNKSEVTNVAIAINPATYKYLTALQKPDNAVGGTTEGWKELYKKAEEKGVVFNTPGTVAYVVRETLFTDKGCVEENILTIEDAYCCVEETELYFP